MTVGLSLPMSSAMRRHVQLVCKLTSIGAYGLSLAIFHNVQPIAAKAYNDLCQSQGMTFGDGEPVNILVVAIIVITVPLLIARSNAVVTTNLTLALGTALGAVGLRYTAGDTPYECFTTGGTYEDHTSGLEGFEFWFIFVVVVSCILLLIDWTVWALRRPSQNGGR
ncbi:hypothetical protein H8B02_08020 [Bradyrhizobium sp. Pear77]|uniref:hypothetical protein n=1 Tax=Bradyrhizobium altum TaxID=1571202 RepID=UPI001E65088A|nr:hypothetical protein [Bradyrhizobium altum]MCC8953407.1 hypothetical protein [Bradyrhizobium altum]